MRPNINRYVKRKDYSRLAASSGRGLDGFGSRPKSVDPKGPEQPNAQEAVLPAPQRFFPEIVDQPTATESEKRNVKLQINLPSFRQPPGVSEAPSRQSLRWIFIITIGLIFFVLGYHNLWQILNR